MKFHSVHGCNITLEDGGSKACRTSSFCDGIVFSSKPIAINSRISLLLGANEDWTGALRVGITTQDPAGYVNKKLPRYACPDLSSKPGFWARPLPESWASNGNRLTFYLNSKGHLHVFINNDHKGAVLSGLPGKDQLWVLLDLYGITVSVKFVSNSGSTPTEVLARGPEAVQAYQHALSNGSTPYYHSRIALIGPPDGKKTLLKKLLAKSCETIDAECDGIDTTCIYQALENSSGQPWTIVKKKNSTAEDTNNNTLDESEVKESTEANENEIPSTISADEEYYKAIATNIVKEMLLHKKKNEEDRKKTAGIRTAFRLQSSLSKIGAARNMPKQDEGSISNDLIISDGNEDLPDDLPKQVVELVEAMLKESELKLAKEKKETEKTLLAENAVFTFNVWNYSGHSKYLFMHQLFLSPQTINIFVFDLAQDLEAPVQNAEDFGLELLPNQQLSTLSLLHIWLEMIFISVAHPKNEDKNQAEESIVNDLICTLFPPVLIVGIQEDSTTFDSVVEHQFNKIKESIQDKVYYHLMHPVFYYVGHPESLAVDSMISELRVKIQELALQLSHFGTEIPLKWLMFEQAVDRLIEREVYFADINKLSEVARLENIESDEEFYSMVHFYHHQGKLWHLGSEQLHGTDEAYGIVILKPQWFIDHIYQLMNTDMCQTLKENTNGCEIKSVISSKCFESIWTNAFHNNTVLDILNSLDILCEVSNEEPRIEEEQPYYPKYMIPWLTASNLPENNNTNHECLVLILDFSGLLPVGFFTRFLVRLFRWSSRHDWKENAHIFGKKDEIPVDYNHSIRLQKIHGHRIEVMITQRKYLEAEEGIKFSYPSPHICSKVRHLMEREIEYLRDVWFKRLSYTINIPCPCAKSCQLHDQMQCTDHKCIHLLPLNECLSKKVMECDYRLVKTDFIQKYFFSTAIDEIADTSDSLRLSLDCMATPIIRNMFLGDGNSSREDTPWIGIVGKMLTRANTGQDWIALAKRLGYNDREIRRFTDETVPPVSVLNNWINSNGRTRYCVDLLITCLEQMGRQDVADYIFAELGPELPSPPVFISYQWESQESVLHLRRRIELAGFSCWMDVGNIQGGEALYGKIYEGINKAKVVLCCLTPRYVLSPLCTREMSLADILRKPIVPIMLEPTPWPPPGALALILSSLVYVDLCGIGGHGGSGRHTDWETRFSNIVERLSHFISPSFMSPGLNNATERHIPPPSTAVLIRHPEEFLEVLEQADERDILDSGDLSLPENDSASESVSITAPSPAPWEQPRRNRVVRCSVCSIL